MRNLLLALVLVRALQVPAATWAIGLVISGPIASGDPVRAGLGIAAGIANIVIAYHASEATWVKAKVFGLTAAMFLFIVAQVAWLSTRAKRAQA